MVRTVCCSAARVLATTVIALIWSLGPSIPLRASHQPNLLLHGGRFEQAGVGGNSQETRTAKAGEGLLAPTYSTQIELLLKLSEQAASGPQGSPAGLKAAAVRSADLIAKQPSYSSFARLIDRTILTLESRHFIAQSWTFDHQEPDRFHVTQAVWNGSAYFYDEWITIGKTHFDYAGFWVEHPEPVRIDLNGKLGLQKYLQLLRNEEPRSGGPLSSDGRSYTLVTYVVPLGGDLKTFVGNSSGSAQVQLWLEADSGLLVNARVVPASAGAPVRELQQAFAGYGGGVQIKAPQTGPQGK